MELLKLELTGFGKATKKELDAPGLICVEYDQNTTWRSVFHGLMGKINSGLYDAYVREDLCEDRIGIAVARDCLRHATRTITEEVGAHFKFRH